MTVLQDVDQRRIGARLRGDGPPAVLRIVWRVAKYVLIALAVIVLLGVLFTKVPTNGNNVIVRNVLTLARDVAGPFKDVFAPSKAQDALVVNYLVAAAAYVVLAIVTGKLPTGGKR